MRICWILILSDLVRHPQGVVAAQITKASEDTVCASTLAASMRTDFTGPSSNGNIVFTSNAG
ncbi:MAG: hypothetical protein WBO73_03205 [Gammaproteobacteria bacterium]